jgi:hypothetical protein
MAHHKRKRPKNQRAGCLMCKPWKMNGFGQGKPDAESASDHRRRWVAESEVKEFRRKPFSAVIPIRNADEETVALSS